MAAAWQQAGQLRETNRQLTITRLQAEIARTWKQKAAQLDAHQRVAVLRSQLTFVRDDDGLAPRRALRDSTFPDALVSPAFGRIVRPGAVVATAAARRNPEGPSWSSSLGDVFGSGEGHELVSFAVPVTPRGTRFDDTRGTLDGATDDEPGDDEPEGPPDDDGPLPLRLAAGFELEDAAALVTAAIEPVAIGRRRVTARIPALVDALGPAPGDELPTRVATGPEIDEALVWSLVELSPELVLPGVERFPVNSVHVVETNPEFVAAFLAGANHEMARELLWREYPADLATTTFRRFWDRPDPGQYDIARMRAVAAGTATRRPGRRRR